MQKNHIELSESDRLELEGLNSKGFHRTKVYKRALCLLELNKRKTYKSVQLLLGVSYPSVLTWAKRYKVEGLSMLADRPRSGRPVEISGESKAKITALACSDPPDGYGRWSLRLLADKAVELGYCEHLSHSEAGKILKKTNFSLTSKSSGASES